jgi:hypothetical protein
MKDDSTKAYSLAMLAVLQAKTGDAPGSARTFLQARKAVLAMPDDYGRVQQLYFLASYQVQAGDSPGAMATAGEIKEPQYKDRMLGFIAIEQARLGNVPQALRTAAGVNAPWEKSWIGREVATIQAKRGDVKDALKTAQAISDHNMRVEALAAVAAAQLKAKDHAGAQQTWRLAIKVAESIPPSTGRYVGYSRPSAFGAIAQARADSGDIRGAALMLDAIDEPATKCLALMQVAAAQARAGNLRAAQQTADMARDTSLGHYFQEGMAGALAERGDIRAALEIAREITELYSRVEALLAIAKVQAKAGDREGAGRTYRLALQAAAKLHDSPGLVGARPAALRNIAQGQTEQGAEQEALAWIAQERDPQEIVSALMGVIQGLADRQVKKAP